MNDKLERVLVIMAIIAIGAVAFMFFTLAFVILTGRLQ